MIREKLQCSRSVSKRVLEPEERTNENSQNLVSRSLTEPFGRGPVAQLVGHRVVTREVVSSTPTGPTLRVLK